MTIHLSSLKNLFFIPAFLFGSIHLNAQPVKEHGALKVKGVFLEDEHGNAVTLRGMSFGWHCLWPRFYTTGSVSWLRKDWGVDVVRAALGVELGENSYLKRPDWSKEKVKTVVDQAIRENVYVIIDWHSHNINLAEAKVFFAEMSAAYGKNPHVIYEIFNEPDKESWQEVKNYSIEVIREIRKNDPDNLILVGSPHWDQDIHIVADDPITGYNNLMYTLHFYAGTHNQFLRDRAEYALNKGIPLFISESAGMEATGDGPINYAEWNKWINWAEEKKISWVTWSVSDKNETCSVLLPSAASDGKWEEKDLRESGIKTRELIRKYNQGSLR
jgi:endoglucanase